MPVPDAIPSSSIPDAPAFPDLPETPDPGIYLHASFWDTWGIWIILFSVLLVVAIIVIILLSRKKRPVTRQLSPAEAAIKDIGQIRETHPGIKHAAVAFSLTLRKYLVGETKDPALYETQQEFNRRANALTTLPSELQTPTRDLLDRMASLKYEPDTKENDTLVNELADATVKLITDIETASHQEQEETDLVVKKASHHLSSNADKP